MDAPWWYSDIVFGGATLPRVKSAPVGDPAQESNKTGAWPKLEG
jgi:hypothetical protein